MAFAVFFLSSKQIQKKTVYVELIEKDQPPKYRGKKRYQPKTPIHSTLY